VSADAVDDNHQTASKQRTADGFRSANFSVDVDDGPHASIARVDARAITFGAIVTIS
jgi:hypothetical protein